MQLPQPRLEGPVSVEKAVQRRRTIRAYADRPLGIDTLAQLLWAAGGITEDRGFKRAAPSAGALYPMDIYVVTGSNSIASRHAGVYHYQPTGHSLSATASGDRRIQLARTSLGQMWMAEAPISLVLTAEYSRITGKYGDRGVRYAWIEAGHMGQNIFLQAEALGLKAGIVGAFHDQQLARDLALPPARVPLLVMPVGYPK